MKQPLRQLEQQRAQLPTGATAHAGAFPDEPFSLSDAGNAAPATAAGEAFSHISIEAGHFEPRDFSRGAKHFANRLRRVGPWLRAAQAAVAEANPQARVSTCFLIDDYTAQIRPPAEVIPRLLDAARQGGICIDYLARESGCVDGDEDSIARSVERRITDIQSLDEDSAGREWSCSFLAAVWQLSRLGLLDNASRNYMTPQKWEVGNPPSRWGDLPSIIQMNHDATPFQAYRTISILDSRYLSVEATVRAILKQVSIEPAALAFVSENGAVDGTALPARVVDRVSYVFIGK
jgi:hypothetical protein